MTGCAQKNHSFDYIRLSCVPGYDGGLEQIFTLELYSHGSINSGATTPIRNVTTAKSPPSFNVRHLEAASIFDAKVYASNPEGRSDPFVIKVSTLKRPSEKRLATTASGGEGERE